MLTLLSRAISTLTGHPLLPRWIQDIVGGTVPAATAEEGSGYHSMDADGTTAAWQGRARAPTGVVVAVQDDTTTLLVNTHKPRPQTNPLQ